LTIGLVPNFKIADEDRGQTTPAPQITGRHAQEIDIENLHLTHDDIQTPISAGTITISRQRQKRNREQEATTPEEATGTTVKRKKLELVAGANLRPGQRAKMANYTGTGSRIIDKAVQRYEALIISRHAFPDAATKAEWVRECWELTCKKEDDWYELEPEVVSLIEQRGSRVRGALLNDPDGVRAQVKPHFRFRTGGTKGDKAFNVNRSKELMEKNTFVYKDMKTRDRYVENKIFILELEWLFHGRKSSMAVTFFAYFDPIPLPTLALLMTMTRACIKEYETGARIKQDFTEDENKKRYAKYLSDLNEKWEKKSPETVKNIRRRMYRRASKNAGIEQADIEEEGLSESAEAGIEAGLEGRTGNTDSEGDGDKSGDSEEEAGQ
ncbi:hypothetical protein BDN72DRAFT_866236, partial [Pluteus cervinus]